MPWAQILGGLLTGLKWAWPYLRTFGVWLGVLAVHTAVMKELWEKAFNGIDRMVTGYTAHTIVFQPIALINKLFPLSEGLTMLGSYMALVLICNTVRIHKAFIDARKS